jgi:hypothetical protein
VLQIEAGAKAMDASLPHEAVGQLLATSTE